MKATPVPLFNYRKRQAVLSDPQQLTHTTTSSVNSLSSYQADDPDKWQSGQDATTHITATQQFTKSAAGGAPITNLRSMGTGQKVLAQPWAQASGSQRCAQTSSGQTSAFGLGRQTPPAASGAKLGRQTPPAASSTKLGRQTPPAASSTKLGRQTPPAACGTNPRQLWGTSLSSVPASSKPKSSAALGTFSLGSGTSPGSGRPPGSYGQKRVDAISGTTHRQVARSAGHSSCQPPRALSLTGDSLVDARARNKVMPVPTERDSSSHDRGHNRGNNLALSCRKRAVKTASSDGPLRILTLTVAGLKNWPEYRPQTVGPVMFEVYGMMSSALVKNRTATGKEFLLTDDTSSINCVFYEIDREMPRLIRGQIYRLVGTLRDGDQVLQVVSVRASLMEERAICQAAIDVSQGELLNPSWTEPS